MRYFALGQPFTVCVREEIKTRALTVWDFPSLELENFSMKTLFEKTGKKRVDSFERIVSTYVVLKASF